MTNLVAKTLTALPEEVCNIIYEYYKLPFVDELPKTDPWHRCEKEWGRELSELIMEYRVSIRFGSNEHYNLKLFGCFDYNRNRNAIPPILKSNVSVTQKLITIKNILVYNCDTMGVPCSKELNRVNTYKPSDNMMLKEMCRRNKIRVQQNSRTKTLIKKLMKL